ncbi:tRNA lysidine(34) synthetase TilS [Corynebacterium pseudokroppenstedtii]|uniref:tRNA(Ile)-lysidine synthase n=2 Tax=Corynebacterium pseudokroppenstedtii TaxID=2804917 RepID=A0AAU0PYA0_9CORY|nr:tRNA lysidine(34) synthetase TilS [Corynebacterium pseudokroppenstedtii]MDU6478311.1 tRNA lysidine(34) synthetase TilS [Corynebacterium kroppenstedtii]MBY0791448.1 tRNA lysidine(34) synthetase TilS [Corynebacterium pseudokroppenstedtii]MCF6794016.1 tRNA lysidine(34) synthetase TilS [Corynebacterium pseudokroppenstedtii]MCF8703462.1 tRNA lysidine(34) synthetase TilS [Corynebacterium pseudokroppenstedtii]MCG2637004.1 tRNA lysidine(34) synthetase TilS [Corynebacterium pseudokroppenstedtii]
MTNTAMNPNHSVNQSGEPTPSYMPPSTKPGPHVLRIRHALEAWHTTWNSLPASEQAKGDGLGFSCLIGCSGGADSLCLVGCAVKQGWRVHAVVIDHGLQAGSADVATRAAHVCQALGATAEVVKVSPREATEAAAREERYRALGQVAQERGGLPVLVAHTGDDQAESLLLGLARGAGLGSIAGMPPILFHHPAVDAGATALGRPLLAVRRDNTIGACAELGITPWHDPTNTSGDNLRSRVRTQLIPQIRSVLGEAAVDNAIATAAMTRTDEDYLARQAAEALKECEPHDASIDNPGSSDSTSLDITTYLRQPRALRGRIIKQWLQHRAGPLTRAHVTAIDALATQWHGQGGVAIPWARTPAPPGRLLVVRRHDELRLTAEATHDR